MNLTIAILIVVTLALILYDLFAVQWFGPPATISRVIYDFSCKHPILAFAAGVLCGHLFWPVTR